MASTSSTVCLKGKRKRPLQKNANPLFCQWLTEWRDEAKEKGWKSAHQFAKALKTIKLFPLPLETGKDCRLLQNFGDKICKMLDERLTKHKKDQVGGFDSGTHEISSNKDNTRSLGNTPSFIGSIETANNEISHEAGNSRTTRVQLPLVSSRIDVDPLLGASREERSKATERHAACRKSHVISDDDSSNDSVTLELPQRSKVRHRSGSKGGREYIPAWRSGPYALLLTLYRYTQRAGANGGLSKQELSHSAQALCDKSFLVPTAGSRYTAWSSMGNLIRKGLIIKVSCPAKYSLTDSGYRLAERLENAEGDSTSSNVIQQSDTCQNSASRLKPGDGMVYSERSTCLSRTQTLPRVQSSVTQQDDNVNYCFGQDDSFQPDSGFSPSVPSVSGFNDSDIVILSDDEVDGHKGSIDSDDDMDRHKGSIDSDDDMDRHKGSIHSDDDMDRHKGSIHSDDDVNITGYESPPRCHSLSPSPPSLQHSPCSTQPHQSSSEKKSPFSEQILLSPMSAQTDLAQHSSLYKIDGSLFRLPKASTKTSPCNPLLPVTEISDNIDNEPSCAHNIHTVLKSKDDRYENNNYDDDDDEFSNIVLPLSERLLQRGNLQSDLIHGLQSSSGFNLTNETRKKATDISNHGITELLSQKRKSNARNKELPLNAKNTPVISTFDIVDVDEILEKEDQIPVAPHLPNQNVMVCSETQPVSSAECATSTSSTSHEHSALNKLSRVQSDFVLLPGTFDIILCLDNREFYGSKNNNKVLLPELMKAGVPCDLRLLHVGDLLWLARERLEDSGMDRRNGRELVLNYIIERKRMDDLVSSMTDGRLKEQKFRMKHCGLSELIIMIEEYGSIQNFSISEDRIKQSIVNSQIIDGFKVKQCGGSEEAVLYLATMTRFLQQHYKNKTLHAISADQLSLVNGQTLLQKEQYLIPFHSFNDASIKHKDLTVQELFAKQLIQIPGVSPDRAKAITSMYPTLVLLLQAYQRCGNQTDKEKLLATVKCGKSERNLGIALSRMLCMLYTQTGPLS